LSRVVVLYPPSDGGFRVVLVLTKVAITRGAAIKELELQAHGALILKGLIS
jgi:hypothetical protein